MKQKTKLSNQATKLADEVTRLQATNKQFLIDIEKSNKKNEALCLDLADLTNMLSTLDEENLKYKSELQEAEESEQILIKQLETAKVELDDYENTKETLKHIQHELNVAKREGKTSTDILNSSTKRPMQPPSSKCILIYHTFPSQRIMDLITFGSFVCLRLLSFTQLKQLQHN